MSRRVYVSSRGVCSMACCYLDMWLLSAFSFWLNYAVLLPLTSVSLSLVVVVTFKPSGDRDCCFSLSSRANQGKRAKVVVVGFEKKREKKRKVETLQRRTRDTWLAEAERQTGQAANNGKGSKPQQVEKG